MLKRVKKWFKDQDNITRKTAGLAEKEASTKRKYDVAMSILDQRKIDVAVEVERRKKNAFDLDLKHA